MKKKDRGGTKEREREKDKKTEILHQGSREDV